MGLVLNTLSCVYTSTEFGWCRQETLSSLRQVLGGDGMNDFLVGLLQNLASAAIGGGVVILVRKYVEYLRHHTYSTFWELPGERRPSFDP